MSAGAPWSVKGIDPKAREVAKDHARRSGMTLGAWLNHVILEDEAAQAVMPPGPRLVSASGTPDLARIAEALDRITERIEASESRTGLAIHGVEHSIRQALARIETAEREQHAAVMRLEGSLAETSAETRDFGDRLRRLETEAGPRSDEALRALEGRMAHADPDVVVEAVLRRLGERLAEAEARTGEALEGLRASLSSLDQRLGSVEHEAGAQTELKFEALGEALVQRVESVRAEVAQRLRETTGSGVEARLAEMAGHVAAAEARSTRAVEAIGRQVLAMAEAVGRKLSDVDQRGAEAIDQVGTEVARIAGAVELRLARGEQAQAQAFERLTAELTRATGDLSERFAASEQRAAEAIAGVGDQIAQVTARLGDGGRAAAADVPDAPDAGFREPLTADAFAVLGPPPEPEPELALPAIIAAPFGPELFSRAEPEPEPAGPPRPETVTAAWRTLDAEADAVGPEEADAFAPIDEIDSELFETTAPQPQAAGPQLSTREVIEQARAAARAQRGEEVPLEVNAKVEPKAASGRLFQGFGIRPRRENTTLQTALMIAGGAAFFSVSAAGLTLLQGQAAREEASVAPPLSQAPRAAMALAGSAVTRAPAEGLAPPATANVPDFAKLHADVEAGAPGAVEALQALAAGGHTQAQLYLGQLYDEGSAGLPRDPAQARRLTALAAEAGDVKAMHNLGVYSYQGEGGPADAAAAAQWFRRAAEGGLVESQYNLGLLYQSGAGVARDPVQARHWFGRAAAKGDRDARRALAALTPAEKPPPAKSPSTQVQPASAQARAPEARTGAPGRPAPTRTAAPTTSPNVQQAQVILTRLGYYEGPADGHATEAYKVALFRYQKDQRDNAPAPRATVAER